MTVAERKELIENDEGWYLYWKSSGLSLSAFEREFRSEIDEMQTWVNQGRISQHSLAYGG